MKQIDIKLIDQYPGFITRSGKPAKFVKYIPTASPKTRLLFVVGEQILGCDEQGTCWSVNGIDSSVTETRYVSYDVFVDNKYVGWINLNVSEEFQKGVLSECSPFIYSSLEDALRNSTEKTYKTLKIEWSI